MHRHVETVVERIMKRVLNLGRLHHYLLLTGLKGIQRLVETTRAMTMPDRKSSFSLNETTIHCLFRQAVHDLGQFSYNPIYKTARSVISNPLSMIANASRSSASLIQSGGFVKNVFQRTSV